MTGVDIGFPSVSYVSRTQSGTAKLYDSFTYEKTPLSKGESGTSRMDRSYNHTNHTRSLRRPRRRDELANTKLIPVPSSIQAYIPSMTFSSIHDNNHLYFVTASIIGWKHLLAEPKYCQIVLDSLAWLHKEKRMLLFAFVIMPSHIPMIIKPENTTIGDVVQDFGSYTAHTVLNQLRMDKKGELLKSFRQQRRDARHAHSIWQDIQAKNIYSSKFLSQKMEYIHSNLVSKRWKLVEDRAEYKYSSACFYDKKITPIIPITDLNAWLMV